MTERFENTKKDFMSQSFGDSKMDKSVELNESMTIHELAPDAYTNKIKNISGKEG